MGSKVIQLAENGDNVNDIQRQVLESLDDRLLAIEMVDKEQLVSYDSVALRMLNNEIKTEKLIQGAAEIFQRLDKLQTVANQHTTLVSDKTQEELLAKTRAETMESISQHEKLIEG